MTGGRGDDRESERGSGKARRGEWVAAELGRAGRLSSTSDVAMERGLRGCGVGE